MIDSLDKPVQTENNDVKVDLHPKVYDPNKNNAQYITLPFEHRIPVEYNGVFPCIAVRKPTNYEDENCE